MAADFRDNLIVDRYDRVFATMDAGKLERLQSEDSKDAITWNVFRSLWRVNPEYWLWPLQQMALPCSDRFSTDRITLSLWQQLPIPQESLSSRPEPRSNGPQGNIDVVLEGREWVWFIDALYQNDISLGTASNPTPDVILRKIDTGTHYAGTRDFYFSLLVLNDETSPVGAMSVEAYNDPAKARKRLATQRPDGLPNFRATSRMTWSMLASTLRKAADTAIRPDEVMIAYGASEWMAKKGLAGNSASR